MENQSRSDVTLMLDRARHGDQSAVSALWPLVYDELRALGGSFFKRQSPNHTLVPTALVHEAFVKLVGPSEIEWESRAHFFAVAAKAMRQILTDHSRRKRSAKRGGSERQRLTLSALDTPSMDRELDLIDLDDALTRLTEFDERQARIVEMRFLAGMKVDEVAAVLDASISTVEREWRMARAWLRRELGGEHSS